ncbi:hypothetical protein Q3G72_008015 [Acer saccharum]|nr:hypothetical protein Q3G72_008015 [Acer saccharum]
MAKIAVGTFASKAAHPDLLKDVTDKGTAQTRVGFFAPGEKVNIDDYDEDGDDQGTLRDLMLRERRSKGRSDWPSVVHSLPLDQIQAGDWVPPLVVPTVRISEKPLTDPAAKSVDKSLRIFTLSHHIILTDFDEEVPKKGGTPKHDTDHFGKSQAKPTTLRVDTDAACPAGSAVFGQVAGIRQGLSL